MRIAFLVNDVITEVDEYTTTRLARAAAQLGHEVWYVGVGDAELWGDGELAARAQAAELHQGDTLEDFMERIKERDAERIVMDDLDAVFLRNESLDDLQERPWASPLGVVLGQVLKARGVTVVNDPMSLVRANSKLYLEEFPERIRPRSLVTRDPEAIERFVAEIGHSVVKPLYGAKGRNVFMIEDEGEANLAQMTEAVLQDGYAIVQQFVDGGEDGDARIFVLEGRDPRTGREARRVPASARRQRPTGQHQRRRTPGPPRGRRRGTRTSSSDERTSSSPTACSSSASTSSATRWWRSTPRVPDGIQSRRTALRGRRLPDRHRSPGASRGSTS